MTSIEKLKLIMLDPSQSKMDNRDRREAYQSISSRQFWSFFSVNVSQVISSPYPSYCKTI